MSKSLEGLQNSLKVKDGRERGRSWEARSPSASEKLIRGSEDMDAACDRVKAGVAKQPQSLSAYAGGDLSRKYFLVPCTPVYTALFLSSLV